MGRRRRRLQDRQREAQGLLPESASQEEGEIGREIRQREIAPRLRGLVRLPAQHDDLPDAFLHRHLALVGGQAVGRMFRRPIVAAIDEALKPRGVAVVIVAEHQCMTLRGAHAHGATTVTSEFSGAFRDDPAEQMRFLALVNRSPSAT